MPEQALQWDRVVPCRVAWLSCPTAGPSSTPDVLTAVIKTCISFRHRSTVVRVIVARINQRMPSVYCAGHWKTTGCYDFIKRTSRLSGSFVVIAEAQWSEEQVPIRLRAATPV
jgi:hypothetical protein